MIKPGREIEIKDVENGFILKSPQSPSTSGRDWEKRTEVYRTAEELFIRLSELYGVELTIIEKKKEG